MIKSLVESWENNKNKIKKQITKLLIERREGDAYGSYWYCLDYADLVEILFNKLKFNGEDCYEPIEFNVKKMKIIDNGDYQGTRVYVIPLKTYQPTVNEHFYTHNYYGSCSGCDTLLAVLSQSNIDDIVEDLMKLSLGLVQNTKRMGD